MLSKSPQDRPTIKEIKANRWLCDQPPIRETLTQDLALIQLAEFHTSTLYSDEDPQVTSGYLPMNQAPGKLSALKLSSIDEDSLDTDENARANVEHFQKDTMRKSVIVVKNVINELEIEDNATKMNLETVKAKITQNNAKLEELKVRVEGKRRELGELKAKETTLVSQISDRTLELERLGAGNLTELTQKISEIQSLLGEKTISVNQLDVHLKGLKTDYSLLSQDFFEKEQVLIDLKSKLSKLKLALRTKQHTSTSETSDLSLRASIFRAQIRESPQFIGQEMQETIEEINSVVLILREKGKNEEFEGKKKREIQNMEEMVFEKEVAIARLTADYQDKKFEILLKAREEKAKIQAKNQTLIDKKHRELRQNTEMEKKRLREELDKSREGCKPVSRVEYEQVREQLLVGARQNLKIAHSLMIEKNKKVEEERARLRTEATDRSKRVENTSSTVSSLQTKVN